MTPLALRISKDWARKPSKRTFKDPDGLLDHFGEAHCFEVSAVQDLCQMLVDAIIDDRADCGLYGFLPAPVTWLEMVQEGVRFAFCLVDTHDDAADVYSVGDDPVFRSKHIGVIPLGRKLSNRTMLNVEMLRSEKTSLTGGEWAGLAYPIIAFLNIINTPKIIGRRQHAPHRSLERRLLRGRGNIGQFPLRAWTEILLDVSPTVDASNDNPGEARLTGMKALHFCRAHLRIQYGRLVIVRGHWRGDPSLGIKRSRYLVTA